MPADFDKKEFVEVLRPLPIPFCQLRASRAVTNFVCSYSLSFIVTLRVVNGYNNLNFNSLTVALFE